ncbi:MAG: 50S ribosomal protein L19e [Candidatus Bathyarchaeia archaeon]|nr:50S ribosomal protein L19e [Candidatus Bathyarchaeota archaeon]
MKVDTQRRIVASMLGVGYHRVWIDPERVEDVQSAITRGDLKALVKDGVIRIRPIKGTSRARVGKRRRGPGSVKGSFKSRIDEGQMWVARIRALRRELKILREKRMITRSTYRELYRLAKGGVFRSVRELRSYIYSHGLARRLPI